MAAEPEARAGHLALSSLRTTASHTIGVPHLVELLRAVDDNADFEAYRDAVIDDNVLGRPTQAGRERTLRHLREMYFLDPTKPEFSVLRKLAEVDATAIPLMAGMLAFVRDCVLRSTFPIIENAKVGDLVTSSDLSAAAELVFSKELSESTIGKCGRNTGACWTQTGHLVGRSKKHRVKVEATPAAVTYAAYLGYLAGKRGLKILETPWAKLLDLKPSEHRAALESAHKAGLLNFRAAGDVAEVSFPKLERAA